MGAETPVNADRPKVVYIQGDGIGPEVMPAAVEVLDTALRGAYGGAKAIEWQEALAGKSAFDRTGSPLPPETSKVPAFFAPSLCCNTTDVAGVV